FLRNGLKSYILNKIKDTWIYKPGKKNIIHKLYKLLLIRILIIEYIQQIKLYSLKTTKIINNLTSFYIKKNVSSIPLRNFPKGPNGRTFSPYHFGTGPRNLAYNNNSTKSFHTQCRAMKRIGPHNIDVISVIFGLLLGDGYASNRSGEGVKISIKQSIIHKEYLFSLYEFFLNRGYTRNSEPRLYNNSKVGNKKYYMYEFYTYTFRSFNWIYKLLYNKGKKVVKLELQKYLTPQALAVWIMSNGHFINGGLQLNTYFHTSQDIAKLISILNNCYGLISSMYEYKKGFYRIEIAKESMASLIAIVDPFIIPNMRVIFKNLIPLERIDNKKSSSILTINR
uniref:LAGLIDADG endonuclease n=1 Tax=Ramaria cf. rubripermanens TaxID=2016387 RepID=UPI0022385A91